MTEPIEKTEQPPVSTTSTFLTIAPEVRSMIYQELFDSRRLILTQGEGPALSQGFPRWANIMMVCRQTYAESSQVFYAKVLLACEEGFELLRNIDAAGGSRYEQFQNLRIYEFDISEFVETHIAKFTQLRHIHFNLWSSVWVRTGAIVLSTLSRVTACGRTIVQDPGKEHRCLTSFLAP